MESELPFTIDKAVFTRLVHRIYALERENFKTKKFRDNEMVEKVRKLIEFEVDKDDN